MCSLTFEILPIDGCDSWDSWINSSPQCTPFVQSKWLRICSEVFSQKIEILTLHDGGVFQAGMVAAYKKKGVLTVSPIFPISLYTGIIFSFNQEYMSMRGKARMSHLTHMLLTAIEKRYHFFSGTIHHSIDQDVFLRNQHWNYQRQTTSILDIRFPESCWEGFSQSLRRKIRRVEETNCKVEECDDYEALIDQHRQSYTRRNIKPPFSKSNLVAWLNELIKDQLIRIFILRTAVGEALASRAVATNQSTAYDWLAGLNDGASIHNASHRLIWDILKRMAAEGYESFDFMGTNTPGPREFKQSFGGKTMEYFQATYFRSRAVKSLEQIQSFFMRKRRKLA